jgi:hypothetical protein
MPDDGGVLGNLPRSRPGQRSEKRTGKTAAKAASRAERSGSKAAAPVRGTQSRGAARTTSSAADDRSAASPGGDTVGHAIRAVTGVAATGARVAGGVAREVIRRLPRP